MLIHIGSNEFVGLGKCEIIVNLQTISKEDKKRIMSQLPEKKGRDYKSAIKTVDGKWIGSVLSSEALAQRFYGQPFPDALYLREDEEGAM